MTSIQVVSGSSESPQRKVVLDVAESEFQDFIKSLLGRPQVLRYRRRGAYTIDATHIQDLNALISQRIVQQNQSNLVCFVAVIQFDDGSSHTLNSIEELIHFRESKALVSTGLQLAWEYLIRFNDKTYPERQVIEIEFAIDVRDHSSFELWATDVKDGEIRLQIKHTARTWAYDIESLLVNYFKNIVKEPSSFISFLRRKAGAIPILLCILFSAVAVTTADFKSTALQKGNIQTILHTLNEMNMRWPKDLSRKIDYLAEIILSEKYKGISNMPFFLIGGIIGYVCGALIETLVKSMTPSFILFTDKSHKRKDMVLKKLSYTKLKFIIGLILSICASIFSNYLYDWLR